MQIKHTTVYLLRRDGIIGEAVTKCYVLSSVGLKFRKFFASYDSYAPVILFGVISGIIPGVIWGVFTHLVESWDVQIPNFRSSILGEWKFNQLRFIESVWNHSMSCICHECKIMFFSQQGLEVHNQQKHKKVEEKDNRILDSFA